MRRHSFLFLVFVMSACTRVSQEKGSLGKAAADAFPSPLGISSRLADLPSPPTPARVKLGRHLFFDKRLSVDGSVSCATCHRPESAFSEPTPVSTGVGGRKGTRKSPSIVNLAWSLYPQFFWDGRAASLEEQARGPIVNPIEMGNTVEGATRAIAAIKGYAPFFAEAFGTSEVTIDRISGAIAVYERTRLSGGSPFDRWQAGEETAISPQAIVGYERFIGKGRCVQCHLGEIFTDNLFHNLGVGWDEKKKAFSDAGRFAISKKTEETGAFKTPGLRDVSKHAPYMHDGSVATLKEVVLYYNRGGNRNPFLSPRMQALDLTPQEIDAMVSFLQTLDGEGYLDKAPEPVL